MTATCQTSVRKRPKHLGLSAILFQIKLPLPGKLSILHRASGVLLFLLLAPLLAFFQMSLTSPEAFASFQGYAAHPIIKAIFAVLIWAYMHHFCAGIRFLLLDAHTGLDLPSARRSAFLVFAASLLLTALLCWRILL
ncbi:MAG: succinate dehydrogenase, cytochrome b556 subunit [Zoogloeaceae bacterium]|jgi:succinate dehydrogenase / fumarate reductase cytochrome b subunit|nr:succinate dehydrogenase, cytochrome b556 subunit [Zoogloeaceae bacterium]